MRKKLLFHDQPLSFLNISKLETTPVSLELKHCHYIYDGGSCSKGRQWNIKTNLFVKRP